MSRITRITAAAVSVPRVAPFRSALGLSTGSSYGHLQRRLDQNPQAMRQRRETVEHPFGTIKARMGATHFLMKTLPRVAGEMALHVLASTSALTRLPEHQNSRNGLTVTTQALPR
jgi:hypothetical protein